MFFDATVLRAALMDVIDAGRRMTGDVCECGHDKKMHDTNGVMGPVGHCKDWGDGCDEFTLMTSRAWIFHRDESSEQTVRRGLFADAVLKRIKELQSPVFNLGVRLQDYCPKHLRSMLPPPSERALKQGCAGCVAEMERKLHHVETVG